MAIGADLTLCIHSLISPVTKTASVIGTTKTTLDSHAMTAAIVTTTGRNLRIRAKGLMTTSAVPVTFNLTVEYGTTVLCQTGVFTPAALLTDMMWTLECDLTTVANNTVEAQGVFNQYPTIATLTPGAMLNTATVGPTTTGIVTPRIAITFGGSGAGNSITIRSDVWVIEGLT